MKKRLFALVLSFVMLASFAIFDAAPVQASSTVTAASFKKAISRKKAISIAKKNAKKNYKVKTSTIRDLEAEKDWYRGKKTWEITFEAKTGKGKHYYEFEYHIARSGGKVLHREKEWD